MAIKALVDIFLQVAYFQKLTFCYFWYWKNCLLFNKISYHNEVNHTEYDKMSFLFKIKFITEDWFTKYTNITTKLNWKLFTKVIKRQSEGILGLDRQSVLIKRDARALLI